MSKRVTAYLGSTSTTDATSDILDIVQPPLIGRGMCNDEHTR
jgi:hypothetical protein